MPLRVTGDLVAIAWLKGVPNIDASKVASTLPEDTSVWGEIGFVQARVIGGPSDRYLPVGRPIVQVDCWAVKPDTGKPLWNVANLLAEHIIAATRDEATIRRPLALPAGYPAARVLEVYPLVEPHRVESDPGSYARFRFDLQFHWVQEAA
jgi:hypothetical protein